jgi:invasion protein IalB
VLLTLRCVALLACGIVLAAAAPAAAQTASGQTFRDWRLDCEQVPQQERTVCYIHHEFVPSAPEGQPRRPAAAVVVGYLGPQSELALILKVPPVAKQDVGLGLKIDEREPVAFPIQECDEGSCTAAIRMTDDLLNQFRAGVRGVLAFIGPENQQINMPISLLGFSSALSALNQARS